MRPRGWTLEDEIGHVDDMLERLGVAIREARANDDHSLAGCQETVNELLDLRSLLVMQREPSDGS